MSLTVEEKLLSDLNESQRQAVTHTDGPLMIVAGAGTGKTSVITRRIAYLIQSGLARPQQILALTFTDKAAQEMQERVDVLLPYGQSEAQISTFHAFGDRLLREYAVELGLEPEFKVLSQAEQVIFLRQHLFELPLKRYRPLGNPTGYLQALLSHISKLKDEVIDPSTYEAWARELVVQADQAQHRGWQDRAHSQLELALCYKRFQELAMEKSLLDYGDQIYLTLKLLRERSAVLQKLQENYRYVLVDEFQDTNLAQFELVRLIVDRHRNLTVVGDDDQSIYAFRGAAISNILQFQQHFPNARQIVLTHNYRSLQPILDTAYRLIGHNNPDRLEVRNLIDKRLVAAGSFGPSLCPVPIEYHQFDTVSSEADAVAAKIVELLEDQEDSVNLSGIAILLRVNRDADAYLRALNYHGIPYRFSGSEGLYQKPEVKLLLCFLRVLSDPKDNLSLFYLASSAIYNFPMTQLMTLNAIAMERHLPLLEVFMAYAQPVTNLDGTLTLDGLRPLGNAAMDVLTRFVEDYREFSGRIPSMPPGRLLYTFVEHTGWLRTLNAAGEGEGPARMQNTARFFDIVRRFEEQHGGALLPQFVDHLNQLIEAGDSPGVVEADPDSEAVQVLTVHASKGLEFPVVFLVGLNEGRFPGRPRSQALEFPMALTEGAKTPSEDVIPGDDELRFHVQEERRLFYVAITRAKQYLWLSNAKDTGGKITRKRSRFIVEALGSVGGSQRRTQGAAIERLQRMAPVASPEPVELPPVPEDRVISLSYYRIRDYLDCPKKYQYAHVVRLPLPTDPAMMYGKAVHSSISTFLQARQDGKEMTLQEMQDHFVRLWEPVGFLNSQHEQVRKEAGLHALERFYAREKDAPLAGLVEESFSIRLDMTRLVGRWDRVDGDSQTGFVLTDYKCAEVESQEKADELTAQSLQLALYSLAHTASTTSRQMPREVSLHFLDSDIVGRAEVDSSHLAQANQKIMQAAAGIRARNYVAAPVFGACARCAYRPICPSAF